MAISLTDKLTGLRNWTRRHANWLVVGLLVLMFVQAFFSSAGTQWLGGNQPPDSGTVDEIAHIPGGYAALKYGDYRLNPEHPPLIKDIASLPLLFIRDLKFPTNLYNWQQEPNGQWETGWKFIYEWGNNAEQIFFWTRLGPMLLLFLLGYFLFRWTKELFGTLAGLFAVFLFAFTPDFIGQARYVTTDVGSTAFLFIAVYVILRFVRQPKWSNLILAALTIALACLAKFSSVLIWPYLAAVLVLAMVFRYTPLPSWLGTKFFRRPWLKRVWLYVICGLVILVLSHAIIFLPYLYHTHNIPDDVYERLINYAFTKPDKKLVTAKIPLKIRSELLKISQLPGGKAPATYFLGMVYVYKNDIGGRNTAFLMGDYRETGWWYYYYLAYLVKMPIPILIFTVMAAVVMIIAVRRNWLILWVPPTAPPGTEPRRLTKEIKRARQSKIRELLWRRFDVLGIVIFILIFWIGGMFTNTNIGLRWMMPTFPFIFLLAAGGVRYVDHWLLRRKIQFHQGQPLAVFQGIMIVLLIWLVVGTVTIYPSYLAYFNEFIGGRGNAYKYLVDSSLDWGQDLNRLRGWMNERGVNHVYLDYLGGGTPNHSLGTDNFTAWHAVDCLPPADSYLVIGATFFQASEYQARNKNEVSYPRILDREPDYQIGYSLLVYHITAADLAKFLTPDEAAARARQYLNLPAEVAMLSEQRVAMNEWTRDEKVRLPRYFKRPAYAITLDTDPRQVIYVDYITGEIWGGYSEQIPPG